MVERDIEISAPIETVYSVIRDFKSYPKFLSTTHAVKERNLKSGLFVDFTIEVIKAIQYTLKFECREPNEISWEFVEGDLMKKNSGAWKLEAISPQKTRAHYSIDISFGWMVPKTIVEQVTKTQLPEMLEAFKERAEAKA